MATKMNINTAEIQKGDEVVGFQTPVASVKIDGWKVKLVFEDGEIFHTSTGFNTTVMRHV